MNKMLDYIVAPDARRTECGRRLFLAGGITGTVDWQQGFVERLLKETTQPVALFNPRRPDFKDEPGAAVAQIEWEYAHLRDANAITFWFPATSVCPIALFELGAWGLRGVQLFVGVDPEYPRKLDIIKQLELARPGVTVALSMDQLLAQVVNWVERRK